MNDPKKQTYRRKLQSISTGAEYDISAQLIKLGREIRAGVHGEVKGMVIGLRVVTKDSRGEDKAGILVKCCGTSSVPELFYTATAVAERFKNTGGRE